MPNYNSMHKILLNSKIALVIPAYRVENEIKDVLSALPGYIQYIIVIDDCSPDRSGEIISMCAELDNRIHLIRHKQNQGVGGAMITGFKKALDFEAEFIVKVDGDGQMNPDYLPALLTPLIEGKADYVKGNRFHDFIALQQMPFVRRFGNIFLSFLVKAATGYWNIFDPTNGYFAINANILRRIPFEKIASTYYFETSMLSELYLLGAYVLDVPIPARYGNEKSNLNIYKVLLEFPPRLIKTLTKRVILKYFLYDFSIVSLYLLAGVPLFLFGVIFGTIQWIKYTTLDIPAPTGTIILPMMCVLLGIQFIMSALQADIQSVPSR
jgi:dolichol-phosphate mannosyltransferase